MTRVLITGMSATGKSTVVEALQAIGYRAVDTDYGWCRTAPDGEWVWDEEKTERLLADSEHIRAEEVLFVAGTASNQGRFRHRFDHIILLTAPVEVVLERLTLRRTNPFGKSDDERAQILADIQDIEPLLRHVADSELDTRVPVDEVVAAVLEVVARPTGSEHS